MRYNGPGNGDDSAATLTFNLSGTKVFVTGSSAGRTSGDDYATIAYRAATGAQLWARRYNRPGNGVDDAASIAISPDGTKVFITGSSQGTHTTGFDYATLAYRAATGARLWASRYNGPDNIAVAFAVAASATRVVVTGISYVVEGIFNKSDYATIGYKP
jgi:hypothetical protein